MMDRLRNVIIAVSVCSCGLLAGTAGTPPGIVNFRPVNDHIYRGAQPTRDGIQGLAKFGIRTVIDLRGGKEHSSTEENLVKTAGMHYVHVPLKGLEAPSDEQIATLLTLLNDSTAWPVFIHCRRGADRTGTVIACYRIAHDHWPNPKALEEARLDGMSWIEHAMEHYILSFKPPPDPAVKPNALGVSP